MGGWVGVGVEGGGMVGSVVVVVGGVWGVRFPLHGGWGRWVWERVGTEREPKK